MIMNASNSRHDDLDASRFEMAESLGGPGVASLQQAWRTVLTVIRQRPGGRYQIGRHSPKSRWWTRCGDALAGMLANVREKTRAPVAGARKTNDLPNEKSWNSACHSWSEREVQ